MKKYISPDIKVVELESETELMATSNVGISDQYDDNFSAQSRGRGWADYEQ